MTLSEFNELYSMYVGGLSCLNRAYANKVITKPLMSADASADYPSILSRCAVPFGHVLRECPYPDSDYESPFSANKKWYEWINPVCWMKLKEGKVPSFCPHLKSRLLNIHEGHPMRGGEYWTEVYLSGQMWILREEWEYLTTIYDIIDDVGQPIPKERSDKWQRVYFKAHHDRVLQMFMIADYHGKESAESATEVLLSKTDMNAITGWLAKKDNRMKRTGHYEYDPTIGRIKFVKDPLPELSPDTLVGNFFPITAVCNAIARTFIRRVIGVLSTEEYVYCDTDSVHFIYSMDSLLRVKAEVSSFMMESYDSLQSGLCMKEKVLDLCGPYRHEMRAQVPDIRPFRGAWGIEGVSVVSKYMCAKKYQRMFDISHIGDEEAQKAYCEKMSLYWSPGYAVKMVVSGISDLSHGLLVGMDKFVVGAKVPSKQKHRDGVVPYILETVKELNDVEVRARFR